MKSLSVSISQYLCHCSCPTLTIILSWLFGSNTNIATSLQWVYWSCIQAIIIITIETKQFSQQCPSSDQQQHWLLSNGAEGRWLSVRIFWELNCRISVATDHENYTICAFIISYNKRKHFHHFTQLLFIFLAQIDELSANTAAGAR